MTGREPPFRVLLGIPSADTDFDWRLPLAMLKAYAQSRPGLGSDRVEIGISEWVQTQTPPEAIAAEVLAGEPGLVGLTCYASNVKTVGEVAAIVKRRAPGTLVVLGGPEVSPDPAGALGRLPADAVVFGEGELTFAELLGKAMTGGSLAGVPGLAYRAADGPVANPPRPPADLETLPSPYLSGILRVDRQRRECMVLETARGCPFDCAFCSWPGKGGKVRYFPEERVRQEVRGAVAQGGGIRLCLADADLFLDRARAKRILRIFREEDPRDTLQFEFLTNPGHFDAELAALADKRGFNITAGLQSTNKAVFREARRRCDLPAFTRGVRLLRRRAPKAQVGIELILGMPGDTPEGYRETLEWVLEQGFDYCRAFHLMVLPGTAFMRSARRLGLRWAAQAPYLVEATPTFPAAAFRGARRAVHRSSLLMNLWPVRDALLALRPASGAGRGNLVRACEDAARWLEARRVYPFEAEHAKLEARMLKERLAFIERPEEVLTPRERAALLSGFARWARQRLVRAPARLRERMERFLRMALHRVLWREAAFDAALSRFMKEGAAAPSGGGALLVCWARDVDRHVRLENFQGVVLLTEEERDLNPVLGSPLPLRHVVRVRTEPGKDPRSELWGEGCSRVVFSQTFSFLPAPARSAWLKRLRRRCAPGCRLLILDDMLGWSPLDPALGPEPRSPEDAAAAAGGALSASGWEPVAPPERSMSPNGVAWYRLEGKAA
ncbi:MAG: hypothetical protein A2X36_16805 [Elusimicrobia bacterium GWA2_69_24]|nr:MAG: hypothetical protein A2X36_16805 [Elusimicrobia bacterium GWA2_69_24]HBL16625.1 hypothetical protein [Elusimicrobiota bacterium]